MTAVSLLCALLADLEACLVYSIYIDCAGATVEEAMQAEPVPPCDVDYTSPGEQKSVWLTMI